MLAGASTDYYIELERGRGAQPSVQMLAALVAWVAQKEARATTVP